MRVRVLIEHYVSDTLGLTCHAIRNIYLNKKIYWYVQLAGTFLVTSNYAKFSSLFYL